MHDILMQCHACACVFSRLKTLTCMMSMHLWNCTMHCFACDACQYKLELGVNMSAENMQVFHAVASYITI